MKVDLPVASWAIVGPGSESAPPNRVELIPKTGTTRRGGRLPLLATALCRRTLDEDPIDLDAAAVLFGTAFGCLTETELFVEHMVEADEATPKPRAFASSVHNAIASKAALDLSAHGPCHTYVHGEVSFAHAMFAAALVWQRSAIPIFVGALDERTGYVERGVAHCTRPRELGEGGAVLRIGGAGPVRITDVAFGRPADPTTWLHQQVEDPGTVLEVGSLLDADVPHPALLASRCALAVGSLESASTDPAAPAITLLGRSRFGDHALLRLAPSPR